MAEPATSTTDEPTGTAARLSKLAWQALPAIAGAVGVLGFVALVGGAIVWVRFLSAGLPADQAVRAMPRQELITIGAVSLVSFAVVGVIVVLALYRLDNEGAASSRTFFGLTLLAVLEFVSVLVGFTELGSSEWLLAGWFAVAAFLAYRGLRSTTKGLELKDERTAEAELLRAAWREFQDAADRQDDAESRMALSPEAPPPDWPTEHYRRAAVAGLHELRDWGRARERWIKLLEGSQAQAAAMALSRSSPPAEADLELAIGQALSLAPEDAGLSRSRGARTAYLTLTLILLAPVIVCLWIKNQDDEVVIAASAVVIVVLAAANFAVARSTRGFAWYGVTALASLILFGAGANIVRTIREPQVQPVALVRKSDGATLCGVYVTQTDDRLYMGRIQGDSGDSELGADSKAGRMFWVPLDDVDVVTIGPIQDMEDARWRAPALIKEALADRPADTPSAPKTNRQTTVTKDSSERGEGIVRTTTLVEQVPVTGGDKGGGGDTRSGSPADDLVCEGADLRESAEPKPKPKPKPKPVTPAARTTPSRPAP